MMAVAVLATLTFAEGMRRKRVTCQRRVTSYAKQEKEAYFVVSMLRVDLSAAQAHLEDVRKTLGDCKEPDPRPFFESQVKEKEGWVAQCEQEVREAQEEIDRLTRLRTRWEQAAARPWLDMPQELHPSDAG
jgi:hypothetical protein